MGLGRQMRVRRGRRGCGICWAMISSRTLFGWTPQRRCGRHTEPIGGLRSPRKVVNSA